MWAQRASAYVSHWELALKRLEMFNDKQLFYHIDKALPLVSLWISGSDVVLLSIGIKKAEGNVQV